MSLLPACTLSGAPPSLPASKPTLLGPGPPPPSPALTQGGAIRRPWSLLTHTDEQGHKSRTDPGAQGYLSARPASLWDMDGSYESGLWEGRVCLFCSPLHCLTHSRDQQVRKYDFIFFTMLLCAMTIGFAKLRPSLAFKGNSLLECYHTTQEKHLYRAEFGKSKRQQRSKVGQHSQRMLREEG